MTAIFYTFFIMSNCPQICQVKIEGFSTVCEERANIARKKAKGRFFALFALLPRRFPDLVNIKKACFSRSNALHSPHGVGKIGFYALSHDSYHLAEDFLPEAKN